MNTLWAILIAIGGGLAVAVPFWAITMHLNKKNWAWEETGKYLRGMNKVSRIIATVEFFVIGTLIFIAIKAATGGF